jgi:PPM family protein phosphatase
LTSYVNNEEICEIVLNRKTEAVDELVQLANERGGSDNISVIIAGMED